MFIKLTRFDNRPIWLNASFVVTVEPRREGVGSIVVPIGDGLDYDVRENPEDVLKLLEGAPVPAVVPVPASDGLTALPADVSPEPEPRPASSPSLAGTTAAEETPKAKTRRRTAKAKAKPAVAKKAKAETASVDVPPREMKLELSEAQVVRLSKLAPKSMPKLKNTLATQFHVADVGEAVAALEAKGVFGIDGSRIVWPAQDVESNTENKEA